MLHKAKGIILKYCFGHVGKKNYFKLDLCCEVIIIVQPHMVYCSVCKALDGMHFVRDLISSGQAHKDHNSPL